MKRPILLLLQVFLLILTVSSCQPNENPFTVVLIPDTQYYSQKNPNIYLSQTQWIIDNKDTRNIKFAIHLGDIVQDAWDTSQWEAASNAHDLLDNISMGYSVAPGNHDLDKVDGINDMTWEEAASTKPAVLYNEYFGESRFLNRESYGGHYGNDNNNNYSFFSHGDLKFMVIALEFAARPEAIIWANELVEKYPDHLVIIETHCYLMADGSYAECSLDLSRPGDTHKQQGKSLYDDLIVKHSNIFMAVSGHITGSAYNITKRTDNGFAPVIELLTDYQREPPLGDTEYGSLGNGWMRVLTFIPGQHEILIETLSSQNRNTEIFHNGKEEFYYQNEDSVSRYSTDPTSSDHEFTIPFNPDDYLK